MKFSLGTLYNWYRKLLRNPQTRWWVIVGTIVYFISPLDFSPDLFPFAGQIDDFFLITLLLSELFQISLSRTTDKPEEMPEESAASGFSPSSPPANPQKTTTIDIESVTIED